MTKQQLKKLRKLLSDFRQHLDFGYSQTAGSINIDNVIEMVNEEIVSSTTSSVKKSTI